MTDEPSCAIVTQPFSWPPVYCSVQRPRFASLAVPLTLTTPLTPSQLRGLLISTTGGVLSISIVCTTVATCPQSSVPSSRRSYNPSGIHVVLQPFGTSGSLITVVAYVGVAGRTGVYAPIPAGRGG